MDKKLVVGWFFGGMSVEHEVSVVTALQAYENLDKEKYQVIPIYVSKSGDFYTNPKFLEIQNYKDLDQLLLSSTKVTLGKKSGSGQAGLTGQVGFWEIKTFPKFTSLDVAFPLFHGSFGEDGSIQGLFEMLQIPYAGLNVAGSALAMDKAMSKELFKGLGLNVAKYTSINRTAWIKDPNRCLKEIQNVVKFPLFVKPNTLGSSIGAQKAKNEDELSFAIEVASTYCETILIEEAFEDVIEVNCAALGDDYWVETSVCEMPVASSEILSFEDKYLKGGKGSKGAGMANLSRVIPAPIPEKLEKEIKQATRWIFDMLGGFAVIRVDFFVNKEKTKFYVNEVNSPPGSLAFYLWNKTPNTFETKSVGLEYKDLLDKLVEYALKRAENRKKTQYTFNSGLLQQMANSEGSKK